MSSHTWEAAEIPHGKLDSQFLQICWVFRYNCGYLSRQNIRLSLLKLKSWPQTASTRSYLECKCVPLLQPFLFPSLPFPVPAALQDHKAAGQVDGAVRCTLRCRHLWGTSSGAEQKSCRILLSALNVCELFPLFRPALPRLASLPNKLCTMK